MVWSIILHQHLLLMYQIVGSVLSYESYLAQTRDAKL